MRSTGKKVRRLPTPESLANLALFYLGRFAASEASLRRVLSNRVRRSAMDDPVFANDSARQEGLREAIEKIVAAHKATGVIDDQAFASLKVASLRRSGGSARRIADKLRHKGVAGGVVGEALRGHAEQEEEGDEAEAELQAARAFARKKRLGPFRERPEIGPEKARKDVATLARAGFGYDVIRQVLGEVAETAPED